MNLNWKTKYCCLLKYVIELTLRQSNSSIYSISLKDRNKGVKIDYLPLEN